MAGCRLALLLVAFPVLFGSSPGGQGRQSLDIYYIDVEGGGATLLVSPSGESLLIDSGFPGAPHVDRIIAATNDAGLKHIDYLVTTHYHLDHFGGAAELAAKLPIRNFVDHGPTEENQTLYQAYIKATEKGRRIQGRAGGTIPIAGLDVQVVSARGDLVRAPLPGAGAPNPLCRDFTPQAEDTGENARSIGTLIKYGRFRTIVLGDLTWNKEHGLVCPNSLLGTVDVYLTTHHGVNLSGPKVLVHALRPRVAVMNNGPKKGGAPEAWQTVRDSPGLEDFWQSHQVLGGAGQWGCAAGCKNVPEQFIANFDESGAGCRAYWIKITASSDGSFVVMNSRNGFSKTYKARRES